MEEESAGGREGERGSSSSTCVQSPAESGVVKGLPKEVEGYQKAPVGSTVSWEPQVGCVWGLGLGSGEPSRIQAPACGKAAPAGSPRPKFPGKGSCSGCAVLGSAAGCSAQLGGGDKAAELVFEGAESWPPSERCRGRAEHASERGRGQAQGLLTCVTRAWAVFCCKRL